MFEQINTLFLFVSAIPQLYALLHKKNNKICMVCKDFLHIMHIIS